MDIELVANIIAKVTYAKDAPYAAFGIVYLIIWYLISGVSLYISISEIKKYSKENCYSVMGTISHIECNFVFHDKYNLHKYGNYEGKTVNMDRVPDHESLVPVVRKAAGSVHYKPVYTYTFNGELRTYTERFDKLYNKFKRKEYYKGVVKELRITKKENDISVVGYGEKSFWMKFSVFFIILGVTQTVGFVFLLANGIWTFV